MSDSLKIVVFNAGLINWPRHSLVSTDSVRIQNVAQTQQYQAYFVCLLLL